MGKRLTFPDDGGDPIEDEVPDEPRVNRLGLIRASDVDIRPVDFVHYPWVPVGAVSLTGGAPGLGKSHLYAWTAAAATQGELAGDYFGKAVNVLMASAEDTREEVLVPRLRAAGADLERVFFVTVAGDFADTLDLTADVEDLRERVKEVDAKWLFIDPLASFLDSGDSHNDQKVRQSLAPLAVMAGEEQIAVEALVHLNKGEGNDALNRLMGSVAFGAMARSVRILGRDRANDDALHIVHIKANWSKLGPSQAFHIEEVELPHKRKAVITSVMVIDGESTVRSEDLLSAPRTSEERTAKEDAELFLLEELADGPVPAKDIDKRAAELDIKPKTLRRAKVALKVVSKQRRGKDGSYWIQSLPADPGAAPKKAKKPKGPKR